ncbi:hypothetical protein [Actinoplanes friuliensis]|uniref:hypothetical protein n=1 Tax=Actinoplanes friuliensis TaxID=196914 RepID=UPI0011DDC98A|nr:hypothetical protein [Actinoplanes friuliensis]
MIGLLAYIGDVQERWQPDDVAAAPASPVQSRSATPSASPSTAAPGPSPATKPKQRNGAFQLTAQPLDARTVEVAVTPPTGLAAGRDYWFFVEIDWRDGNTDYYPREKLTGATQTLVIDIPPDATQQADRTGRVYALTTDQSREAAVRLQRQRTSKEDDFFADAPGATASQATGLPFGP